MPGIPGMPEGLVPAAAAGGVAPGATTMNSTSTGPAFSNVSDALNGLPRSIRCLRSIIMMWKELGLSSTVSPGLISTPSGTGRFHDALIHAHFMDLEFAGDGRSPAYQPVRGSAGVLDSEKADSHLGALGGGARPRMVDLERTRLELLSGCDAMLYPAQPSGGGSDHRGRKRWRFFGFRKAVVGGFRALRGSASVRAIRRSAATRSGRAQNILRHLIFRVVHPSRGKCSNAQVYVTPSSCNPTNCRCTIFPRCRPAASATDDNYLQDDLYDQL